ncbi:hypothetical protein IWX50DRAFT_635168 [Phyllosticta citricarpa]|uniref:Uncharacterized protein n=1 Tax=Phyllosticta citricarpa TaxID=55181 RepID=A0ABR1MQ05_9PEZI
MVPWGPLQQHSLLLPSLSPSLSQAASPHDNDLSCVNEHPIVRRLSKHISIPSSVSRPIDATNVPLSPSLHSTISLPCGPRASATLSIE